MSSISSTSNCRCKQGLAATVTSLRCHGMAAYGWEEPIQRIRGSPNQGPLKSLRSLDVYSSMRFVPLHAEGLAMPIEMRGGLEMIKMEGLAAVS